MRPVRYRIEHETRYAYDAPASQSWQRAHLTPRRLPWQTLLAHAVEIDPRPDERHDGPDAWGNTVIHFGLHGAHRRLRVRMQAEVEVGERPALVTGTPQPWESVRDALVRPGPPPDLDAARLTEATALLPLSESARHYAAASWAPGGDGGSGGTALMHRIHADFEFQPGATTVSTSVEEVLRGRRGVCQDFAHLMLAALRAWGLPARYVSGYLLTDPPPGQARLVGVDASHAWVAAWSPWHGWVEFDPTNGQLADPRYVTLAWGADFADVVPLRGVILGGGAQAMEVAVNVVPVEP